MNDKKPLFGKFGYLIVRFQKMEQFWSEIILINSNRTRAVRSFDFEIMRMISDQIALHSVQLPLSTKSNLYLALLYSHIFS